MTQNRSSNETHSSMDERRQRGREATGAREGRTAAIRAAMIKRLQAGTGYADIAMSAIAPDVGLQASSLYNYFSSKEELLRDCLQVSADARRPQPIADQESFPDYIARLVEGIVDHWRQEYGLLNASISLAASHRDHKHWWQRHVLNTWVDRLIEATEREQHHRRLPTIEDTAFVTNEVIWMTHYSCHWVLGDASPNEAEGPRPEAVAKLRRTLPLSARRMLGDIC